MKTITRRTALAVPVTLPLLPVSAFAQPADPAVEAAAIHQDCLPGDKFRIITGKK